MAGHMTVKSAAETAVWLLTLRTRLGGASSKPAVGLKFALVAATTAVGTAENCVATLTAKSLSAAGEAGTIGPGIMSAPVSTFWITDAVAASISLSPSLVGASWSLTASRTASTASARDRSAAASCLSHADVREASTSLAVSVEC